MKRDNSTLSFRAVLAVETLLCNSIFLISFLKTLSEGAFLVLMSSFDESVGPNYVYIVLNLGKFHYFTLSLYIQYILDYPNRLNSL